MRIIENSDNYPSNMKITKFSVLLLLALASFAHASVVDLGQAAGFSVLTYNTPNISDSAFQGAPLIGVVNGDWKQSGGQQTNNQQPSTVMLSPGHNNNGPAILTTVYDANRLNQAWTDAVNASAMLASLTPTSVLGNITSGMTISESAVGNYVLSISNINLNQTSLTLSAPVGSTFVLNISGNITLAGGSQGNGLLLAGGLTGTDVVYNLVGANSKITSSGGGNSQHIDGIVLATGINQSVNLHPGQIDGEVIARTFTSSSGALVFSNVPEVTPSSVMFGFVGLIVAASSRRMLSRRLAATRK